MLIYATTDGHMDIVRYLVEELKVNVNEVSTNGESPLHRACYFNRLEIAQYLIDHGANIEHRSKQDVTPYLIAIMRVKP